MKVLLTGGAGFIGSNLAEALLRRKDVDLVIVDNLDDFYDPFVKKQNLDEVFATTRVCGFYNYDVSSLKEMSRLFERERPDTVIHLAARPGVRPSVDSPYLYEQVNVGGTLTILELCHLFRVQRLIFASSSSVYGTAVAPFNEDTRPSPFSPYAVTKLSAELYCHLYARLYKLPVVVLRLFTVYGPRQRPDLVINQFVSAIEDGKKVTLYGKAIRDYTYISDVVEGFLAALDYMDHGRLSDFLNPFEIFNIGRAYPTGLMELVHIVEWATKKEAALIEQDITQLGDVPITLADISKSRRLLGYDPKISLQAGVKKYVEWRRGRAKKAEDLEDKRGLSSTA